MTEKSVLFLDTTQRLHDISPPRLQGSSRVCILASCLCHQGSLWTCFSRFSIAVIRQEIGTPVVSGLTADTEKSMSCMGFCAYWRSRTPPCQRCAQVPRELRVHRGHRRLPAHNPEPSRTIQAAIPVYVTAHLHWKSWKNDGGESHFLQTGIQFLRSEVCDRISAVTLSA